MQKRRFLAFFSIFVLSLALAWGFGGNFPHQPVRAQSTNLTVSAAISLKDALEEIKTLYQKSQPNVRVTYNFGSSGSLQQQIEQGAPVDIFISAAPKQMDALQQKQLLLSGTRRNLVSNSLVLITPKNQQVVKKFQDLTNAQVKKVALGDPSSVPAGQYGEQALKFYKILDSIKSRIIYAKDVRQVLTYVETDNVEAGIVYATDARTSQQVRVAATASPQSHQPITYPIAVLKSSKNQAAARAFSQYLSSSQAKAVFKKYGFST